MFSACLVGDLQVPYHDPRATAVAQKIISDVKPDVLVINGDGADFRELSRYPLTHDQQDRRLSHSLVSEVERTKDFYRKFIPACRAKKVKWLDGNHEWRIIRAMEKDPTSLKLAGFDIVKSALCSVALLDIVGWVDYVGAYPQGLWLHPGLADHENVWVEHGYSVRKEAGYTVTNLIKDRMASCIVNHCEKLSIVWKRALGKSFFGIENGNLSVIGEPGKGDGIYGGVPHSVPAYMNHRQGFSIIYHCGQFWHPFTVKIESGRAVWAGRIYRA